MAEGTLFGHAIPVRATRALDHTYVTSDGGHSWGCYGRSSGGRAICSGHGNLAEAECLSQPNGQAGIRYFRTGVCHQSANRILYAAKTIVAAARGARSSFFRWGVYGLDEALECCDPFLNPWRELRECRASHKH